MLHFTLKKTSYRKVRGFLSVDGPLGTQVAVCVPGIVDVGDDDTLAGVGGVDELAVSNVDTHMEDAAGTAVAGEEEQIAGEQVGLISAATEMRKSGRLLERL